MAQPDGVIVHGDVAISEIATKRFKITITSSYADKSASGTPSFITRAPNKPVRLGGNEGDGAAHRLRCVFCKKTPPNPKTGMRPGC